MFRSPESQWGPLSAPVWRWLQSLTRSTTTGDDGLARITARQIYILPTRFGLLYGAMLLAMLLGSNNYGSNPGFLLTFLLAGLGMAALLQTWKNLLNLEVRITPGEPVFKGTSSTFLATLNNPHGESRPGINLRAQGETGATDPVDVPATTSCQAVFHRRGRQRGWLTAGRVVIETRFPLGLFRAWSYVNSDAACLVYPAPASAAEGISRGGDTPQASRPAQSGDEDFAGHRPYQDGDAAMHVDWKVLARGMGWQVKRFESPKGEEYIISWDATSALDTESRLSAMTRAILDLDADGKSWGLELPGHRLPPATGAAHTSRGLKALALFNPSGHDGTA